MDLRHIDEENNRAEVEIGVDLTEFYMSVEWDILEVPAIRNVKYYTCCDEPYLDITFNVTMRLVHTIKVQLFWEGQKNLRNRPHGFVIYLLNVKAMRMIAQMFVVFLEKLNFIKIKTFAQCCIFFYFLSGFAIVEIQAFWTL